MAAFKSRIVHCNVKKLAETLPWSPVNFSSYFSILSHFPVEKFYSNHNKTCPQPVRCRRRFGLSRQHQRLQQAPASVFSFVRLYLGSFPGTLIQSLGLFHSQFTLSEDVYPTRVSSET